MRLVGAAFPLAQRLVASCCRPIKHNSVNGIREFARRPAPTCATSDSTRSCGCASVEPARARRARDDTRHPHLFAFPAQSNFSGVRHPLEQVRAAQAHGYRVLVDAAAYVPTHPLSLRAGAADFVALSFYKMFGYPTGHRRADRAARRARACSSRAGSPAAPWTSCRCRTPCIRLRQGPRRSRRAQSNFLGDRRRVAMASVVLDGIGMRAIERTSSRLTAYAARAAGRSLGRHVSSSTARATPRIAAAPWPSTCSTRAAASCRTSASRPRRARPASRSAAAASATRARPSTRSASRRSVRARASPTRRRSPARLRACLGDRAVGALRLSLGIPSNRRDVDRLVALLETL